MPAKVSYSKEQVRDAAFELVRAEGLSALSARRVARQLGCSTQPVYSVYGSMEALTAAVLARAEEVAKSYLAPDDRAERPYLQVGLGSLRFAQQEPQLFRCFALSGAFLRNLQQGKPPPAFLLERMKADPLMAGLTDEQLTRVNTLLWFFSQGLATLFISSFEGDPMPMAVEYLKLAAQAVVEFERKKMTS